MDDTARAQRTLQITVVVCLAPRQVLEQVVWLHQGATVRDALSAVEGSTLDVAQCLSSADSQPVGIWGRATGLDSPLTHLDRVEIYRPLTVDPKVARRERFAQQGARTTGLFARQRPGAKPGY